MKLGCNAPSFIVLEADQSAGQITVVGFCRSQTIRQCVEAIRDTRQFTNLWPLQTIAKVAQLKLLQAARQVGQRPQHASQRKNKEADNSYIQCQRYDC